MEGQRQAPRRGAIADIGVNNEGNEPGSDLEIVTGCDGCCSPIESLWRCFDSNGNLEWATFTQADEPRSSVAIADLNGDGYLEIAAGTTSGETVEVMDRFGGWFWTFPDPPSGSPHWL